MRRHPAIRLEENTRLDLAGREVSCLLRRSSARRTLALRVDTRGRVVVNVPLHTPASEIDRFVGRHADWLQGQLAHFQVAGLLWQTGQSLPYLGGWLELSGAESAQPPQRIGHLLQVAGQTRFAEQVTDWYRAEARTALGQRLAVVCRGFGRLAPPWRLSNARTRWGSLSAKGVVSLNWRLVKAAPALIDYVICHELAHLRQRNHSPAFWREVAALCPGYAEARTRLRANGRLYFQF